MIISLRGTSGSGKSHLVRQVVALYKKHHDVFARGRRKPLYTWHERAGGRALVVPGHYLIANGGIDTLDSLEQAYDIARRFDDRDVLMEGKNMSDGVKHVMALDEMGLDVRVVHLCTPLEICVASVRDRGHSISADSIRRTNDKVLRDYERFECRKFSGSRDECLATVRGWLGA